MAIDIRTIELGQARATTQMLATYRTALLKALRRVEELEEEKMALLSACHQARIVQIGQYNRCTGCGHRVTWRGKIPKQTRYQPQLWFVEHIQRAMARRGYGR